MISFHACAVGTTFLEKGISFFIQLLCTAYAATGVSIFYAAFVFAGITVWTMEHSDV
jgi:hypothetical protein